MNVGLTLAVLVVLVACGQESQREPIPGSATEPSPAARGVLTVSTVRSGVRRFLRDGEGWEIDVDDRAVRIELDASDDTSGTTVQLLGLYERIRDTDELQDDVSLDTLAHWVLLGGPQHLGGAEIPGAGRPSVVVYPDSLGLLYSRSSDFELTSLRVYVKRGAHLIARTQIEISGPRWYPSRRRCASPCPAQARTGLGGKRAPLARSNDLAIGNDSCTVKFADT